MYIETDRNLRAALEDAKETLDASLMISDVLINLCDELLEDKIRLETKLRLWAWIVVLSLTSLILQTIIYYSGK